MNELSLEYYFEDLEACPFEIDNTLHPWDLLKLKNSLFSFHTSKIQGFIQQSAIIKGIVHIGENTIVDEYVSIQGPCWIGNNCIIRSSSLIRPYSVIGDYVVIGHNCEVKNSLLFNDVKVSSHAVVSDSIIGKGARIGPGTTTDNRRFDQKEVELLIKDQIIQTQHDKFGLICGDYVRIGSNVSTLPGTVIGKYTWAYSNTLLYGFIPKEKFLKLSQTCEIIDKEPRILRRGDKSGTR
jgi:bifunctional UDP-N-acetylglucosamine pyrophosphorylase/glucosamine-1-phosphate N-acetyltransferase